jgi:peptidoglycan hydrolase-like protein with peptidoglycan-binding domain
MKKFIFALMLTALAGTALHAQDTAESKPPQVKTATVADTGSSTASSSKRGPVFRPTKDQIKQVQAMLKTKTLYSGEASGTYNEETRAGIRSFQKDNGLSQTGTLNRATLEKMGVALTDSQKAIPVSESSYATNEPKERSAKTGASGSDASPKKPAVFRATADQIKEAQRTLKSKSMYAGGETGKLDDATRAGLKKYQEANSLKVTGTLNQATLESMGITLTEKQKGPAAQQK